MNAVYSLVIANIALWCGFAFYFLVLSKKQQKIQKQLQSLAAQLDSEE